MCMYMGMGMPMPALRFENREFKNRARYVTTRDTPIHQTPERLPGIGSYGARSCRITEGARTAEGTAAVRVSGAPCQFLPTNRSGMDCACSAPS